MSHGARTTLLCIGLAISFLTPREGHALRYGASRPALPQFGKQEQTALVERVVDFRIGAGPYTGTPELQARSYLADRVAELGMLSLEIDLELVVVQHGPWGDHVRFRQTAGGIPILESQVVVTIQRSTGIVRTLMSRTYPGAAPLASVAVITPETALDLAAASVGATPERIGTESAELALYPQGQLFPLVFRAIVPAADPLGDWEVLVDATTGEVVRVRDQAVSVDGGGLAYDPDPLTTAGVDYGAPGYTDLGDATTPQLDAERVIRTLKDLTFSGGVYHLDGPYCDLVDFESPASPPVTEADPGGFIYDRSQQGFEDVEVYWGIDMSQRWIQSLGFNAIQNTPIQCDPHGLSGADNSHYIPSQNRLAWGEGGVDDAEDLDVVLHEYGHAIQHWQVPGWGGLEPGGQDAMGEGFGDYWAGSHSAEISSYRDNWVFNWDGHNEFWGGRVLDYNGHYPEDLTGTPLTIHTDGQMWSSTLMSTWHETCREIVDRNTLDCHYQQGAGAVMHEAAEAWVESDQNLHEGLNVDSFYFYGEDRGFFGLPFTVYDVPTTTHTPIADNSDPGPYTVTVNVTSGSAVTGGEVRYGTGGAITDSAPLTATGNPGEWEGDIPGQGNATISYYVVVENADGFKATEPRPAPCGGVHSFVVTGVTGLTASAAPGVNALESNRPNPFNPSTTITYSLAERGHVRLAIHDARGALVRLLVDHVEEAEAHTVAWDGRDQRGRVASSGVYTYTLSGPGFEAARKMVLLK